MKPVVDGLEAKYGDKVEFRRLNVESDANANQLANSLGVTGVPTFIFVNADGVQAGQIVGSAPEAKLAEALDGLQ
ncbi:MAG: thioredoxin family protein [Coriobacteriia bacterium]|nr:thioredoxin family protein [Coriobacteriia bacterium]